MSDNIDAVISALESKRKQSDKEREERIELDRRRGQLLALIDKTGGLEVTGGESHADFVHRWASHWLQIGKQLRLQNGPEILKHLDLTSDPAYAICVELLERTFWTLDRAQFESDLLKALEGLLRAKSPMSLRCFFPCLRKELLEYWSRIQEAAESGPDQASSTPLAPVVPHALAIGRKKLYPSQETAYQLAQWAFRIDPHLRQSTDTDLYDWLKSRPDRPRELPSASSFVRNLGAARSFRGEYKREQRKWGTSRSASTPTGAPSDPPTHVDSDSTG